MDGVRRRSYMVRLLVLCAHSALLQSLIVSFFRRCLAFLSACCASRFTWASTSDTEAQEARDKHNCRSCGALVCNPCSKTRVPLPSIGITVPVRVCDRCYNDYAGVLAGDSVGGLTSSYMEDGSSQKVQSGVSNGSSQPERRRERRSHVVDELASRIQSTVSCS